MFSWKPKFNYISPCSEGRHTGTSSDSLGFISLHWHSYCKPPGQQVRHWRQTSKGAVRLQYSHLLRDCTLYTYLANNRNVYRKWTIYFLPIPTVWVCKHIKLCSFISKVLFPVLWKIACKYLNLLCVETSWRKNPSCEENLQTCQLQVASGIISLLCSQSGVTCGF